MKLPADAEKLIQLLQDGGYRAYAVGGCVRDSLIGREIGDIDITTSATPQETERVLEAAQIRCVETGLKHGTVTAIVRHVPYEITTFRSDGTYLDNRHPSEVTFVTDLREDLARRDFTVNALAFNEAEGVIDAFDGLTDLRNGLIRAVGDPDRRFREDALRIMRAIRFASVLGFTVEEQTKASLFRNKELLKNIAAERIYAELNKLLLGDACEAVLQEYREIIAVIIPELKPCFDFPQNSKWHIYDVYTHIVKSVAIAPKKDYVRLALLLHDVGKPPCVTTDKNGVDHFKGHSLFGRVLAEDVLRRLRVSNEVKNKVLLLVSIHDLFISPEPAIIKKWLRDYGEEMTVDYLDVKIADLKTHNPALVDEELRSLEEIKSVIGDILNSGEPYRIADLLINGNDLLELGYSGKEIADELNRLVEAVSRDPAQNNREKLLLQAEKDMEI